MNNSNNTVDEIVRTFLNDKTKDNESYRCAVVMVAALFVGLDVNMIVQLTGYPEQFVETVASNLRLSGMWVDGQLDYGECSNDPTDFYMQVSVAEGNVVRRRG